MARLSSHTRKASQTIASLSTIVSFAGSRRNQAITLFAIPLMYTLNVALVAERWRRMHGKRRTKLGRNHRRLRGVARPWQRIRTSIPPIHFLSSWKGLPPSPARTWGIP